MNKEREEVYQILELGKHEKNLHHKKGFGGLLFIDLSMIKFSKLSSYIRQLDKENKELKKQLHDASIQIQELTEQDIWCPSNCEKLEKLQQENEKLKDNWDKLKEYIRKTKLNEFEKSYGKRYSKTFTQAEVIVCNIIIDHMQELEKVDK